MGEELAQQELERRMLDKSEGSYSTLEGPMTVEEVGLAIDTMVEKLRGKA